MKNLPAPLISVVIPVYNPDEIIIETIQSVINQTCQDFEIIIVDDGSEMDITPYIEQVNDKRLIVHKLEHNNANVARNYGISHSTGKYIALLDADDLWLESHLEECLHTIRAQQADGLYGSLFLKYDNGIERPYYVRKLHEGEKMINYLLSSGVGAQTSTLFLTKESAIAILWDETLHRHQDYDFIVRYNRKYTLVPKFQPTVKYRDSNKKKHIDYNSCIRFIQNNMKDIEPQLYNQYNLQKFVSATHHNASHEIIKHYQKEATKYKSCISYDMYMSIKNPQSSYKKMLYKIEYIFSLLKNIG